MGLTDKLESLELLISSGFSPAGLSHVFPLSFLHATESFPARVQHLGEDCATFVQSCGMCLKAGICPSAVVGLLAQS